MPTSLLADHLPLASLYPNQESFLLLDSDAARTRERLMSEAVLPNLTSDDATAQLPSNPKELLTPVEHEALLEGLATMARQRREAETASASLRLA